MRGSAENFKPFIWVKRNSKSEINNSDVVIMVNHDVVGFDVTVHYPLLVTILYSFNDLLKNKRRFSFRNSLVRLLLQIFFEGFNSDELHDEVDLFW